MFEMKLRKKIGQSLSGTNYTYLNDSPTIFDWKRHLYESEKQTLCILLLLIYFLLNKFSLDFCRTNLKSGKNVHRKLKAKTAANIVYLNIRANPYDGQSQYLRFKRNIKNSISNRLKMRPKKSFSSYCPFFSHPYDFLIIKLG